MKKIIKNGCLLVMIIFISSSVSGTFIPAQLNDKTMQIMVPLSDKASHRYGKYLLFAYT